MSTDPKPPTDPALTWDELLRDRDLERLNEIPRSRLALGQMEPETAEAYAAKNRWIYPYPPAPPEREA